MSRERKRRIAALACLIAAIFLTAAFFLHAAIFPRPDCYASVHQAPPVEPLMGFASDSVFNTGSAKELDAFPGIGEVLSQRIVEGRDILGDYRLPTDLLLVKGIGPKTLARILEALNEPLVPVNE